MSLNIKPLVLFKNVSEALGGRGSQLNSRQQESGVVQQLVKQGLDKLNHSQNPLVHDESGRPCIQNTPDLRVSVSHSRGAVVLALSAASHLGIDIVGLKDSERIEKIAARYFIENEPVSDLKTKAWEFAAHEAAMKSLGKGILCSGLFDRSFDLKEIARQWNLKFEYLDFKTHVGVVCWSDSAV